VVDSGTLLAKWCCTSTGLHVSWYGCRAAACGERLATSGTRAVNVRLVGRYLRRLRHPHQQLQQQQQQLQPAAAADVAASPNQYTVPAHQRYRHHGYQHQDHHHHHHHQQRTNNSFPVTERTAATSRRYAATAAASAADDVISTEFCMSYSSSHPTPLNNAATRLSVCLSVP